MKNNKSQKNIPDGWQQVKLGELFEFKNGVNSEGSNYGSGIKFINIMEVIRNDALYAQKILGRVSLSQKIIDNNLVEYGDVLFNRTSETPLEIGITAVYLDDEPVVFGGFVIRAREIRDNLEDNFKKYCFSSNGIRKEIVRRCQGVVRGNIGQGDLEKVPFIFPPILEQKRIVSVLETWDRVIEKLARKIEVKKNIKKGLMQNLLTRKVRLPGFSEKWLDGILGDFLERIEGGGTPSKENASFWNGSIPWASVKDVVTHNPHDTQDHISEDGLKNSSSRLVVKGTLIVPTRMALGHAVFFDVNVAINQDLKAIYPKNVLSNKYLYHWFKLKKQFIERLGSGSTVSGIQLSELKSIKIALPPLEEQSSIAKVLTTADEEIETLQKKLAVLKDQKKYLLNNLITGTIRTPEDMFENRKGEKIKRAP